MSTPAKKPGEIFDHFKNLSKTWASSYFFSDPTFEHMTIKDANVAAEQHADQLMRFAVDFHQSMSYAEQEAKNE